MTIDSIAWSVLVDGSESDKFRLDKKVSMSIDSDDDRWQSVKRQKNVVSGETIWLHRKQDLSPNRGVERIL